MNLNNNEQEIPEVLFEEYALKNWMPKILYSDQRSKQNHKKENLSVSPNDMRTSTDVESKKCSFSDYEVSNKMMYFFFTHNMCDAFIGLITSGKRAWQEEAETRKDSSIALTHQEKFFCAISLILHYRTKS